MKDRQLISENEPAAGHDNDPADATSPSLISEQELRAAGALDVPAAWRKSLGVERGLFADAFEEAGPRASGGDAAPPKGARK